MISDDYGDLFGHPRSGPGASMPEAERAFGGKTYDPGRDFVRLKGQLARAWKVMLDGRIRTLAQIARETSAKRTDGGRDSEAAISARIRDFRKLKFGGHAVEAYNGGGGLWWYRLVIAPPPPPPTQP